MSRSQGGIFLFYPPKNYLSDVFNAVTCRVMKSDNNSNLPAFPIVIQNDSDAVDKGFSKREVIAKDCLAAIIRLSPAGTVKNDVELAVEYADKLLKELSK